jgi:hypothetical protein
VNSHCFELGLELQLATIPLIAIFGGLNISTFSYPSHHHEGATPKILWIYYGIFLSVFVALLVCSVLLGLIPRALAGDFVFFCMVCYALFGWTRVPSVDRAAARREVQRAESETRP